MSKGENLKTIIHQRSGVTNTQPPMEGNYCIMTKEKELSPRLERALRAVEKMEEEVELILFIYDSED